MWPAPGCPSFRTGSLVDRVVRRSSTRLASAAGDRILVELWGFRPSPCIAVVDRDGEHFTGPLRMNCFTDSTDTVALVEDLAWGRDHLRSSVRPHDRQRLDRSVELRNDEDFSSHRSTEVDDAAFAGGARAVATHAVEDLE